MPLSASPLPLLLAAGAFIGATFPLAKLAGEAGISPILWSFLISAGSASLLLIALAARRAALPASVRHLRYYAIGGVVSYALPNLLLFSVIPHIGAGFASVLFTLSPIITLVFASALRVRRPGPLGLVGIAVGFVGAVMIVLSKGQVDRPAEPFWLALAFLIPVSLAIGNVYRTLDWPPATPGLPLAVGTNLASALALAAAAHLAGDGLRLSSLAAAPVLAAAQVAASSAMFAVFFRLQAVGGPVYLSQIGYVAAAIGLGSGTLILGEHYGPLTWLGGVVVAIGVVLTTIAQSRRP